MGLFAEFDRSIIAVPDEVDVDGSPKSVRLPKLFLLRPSPRGSMPRERPVWIAGRQVEVSPVRKFQVPRANPQSPPQTSAAFDDVARSYRKPAGKLTGMESHGDTSATAHMRTRVK